MNYLIIIILLVRFLCVFTIDTINRISINFNNFKCTENNINRLINSEHDTNHHFIKFDRLIVNDTILYDSNKFNNDIEFQFKNVSPHKIQLLNCWNSDPCYASFFKPKVYQPDETGIIKVNCPYREGNVHSTISVVYCITGKPETERRIFLKIRRFFK